MRGGAGDGDGPSIITVPALASLNFVTEDSISDDVFEMDDDRSSVVTNVVSGGLTPATVERPLDKTPSPTGYRDYKPPAEVLSNNYSTTFKTTGDFDSVRSALKRDQEKEDSFAHKTILLGDSGVGKTSLLVQFDTGRFQPGNFAATVGIGFTGPISAVEETLRNMSRRSKHGTRGTGNGSGTAGADWFAAAARGPAQPTPVAALPATSTASAKSQDITGPTRRQCSRDSVDSAGQHTPPDHADLLFKVMLLGDSGVGKTCLLTRFRDGHFLSGNYITTVGIDFRNKVVTVDDTPIKLQIWDTAGQERFRSVTHAYYRDAHALLLLYDVTNKTSYDNIRAWLSEIWEHANEDVVIMLLGNKSDCGTERVVKKEDGKRLAQEYEVPFMETSAKTGLNVELAFLAVARELKARKSNDPDGTKFNVQDYVRQQSQRSSCTNFNCL